MSLRLPVEGATVRYRQLLRRLEATRAGGVALAAGRRFVEIDGRSRVAALALDVFVALVPLAVVLAAFAARNPNSHGFAGILVHRFELRGRTAREILGALPLAAVTIRGANLVAVAGFLLAGYDLTNCLQTTYALAWRTRQPPRPLEATLRGTVWLLLGGVFAIGLTFAGPRSGRAGLVPHLLAEVAVGVAFWTFSPRVLLPGPLSWRALWPGALVSTVGLLLLQASDSLFLPGTIDQYAQLFGALGVAIALLFWLWLVALLWVVGAVVSAVLWERNTRDSDRRHQPATRDS